MSAFDLAFDLPTVIIIVGIVVLAIMTTDIIPHIIAIVALTLAAGAWSEYSVALSVICALTNIYFISRLLRYFFNSQGKERGP